MLAKEGQLTAYKKNMKPLDLEKERSKFDAKKLKVGLDSMKLSKEVKNIVIEMSHIRIKIDVLKLSVEPSNRKEEILKSKLEDLINEVNNLEAKLGDVSTIRILFYHVSKNVTIFSKLYNGNWDVL